MGRASRDHELSRCAPQPAGRIIERLGASSDAPGMDIQIVIHKHDLPHVFPDEVIEETEAVSPVVTKGQIAGRLICEPSRR